MKFAIYFGNRGFFPGELVESAIADFRRVLKANGHEALIMEGRSHRRGLGNGNGLDLSRIKLDLRAV